MWRFAFPVTAHGDSCLKYSSVEEWNCLHGYEQHPIEAILTPLLSQVNQCQLVNYPPFLFLLIVPSKFVIISGRFLLRNWRLLISPNYDMAQTHPVEVRGLLLWVKCMWASMAFLPLLSMYTDGQKLCPAPRARWIVTSQSSYRFDKKERECHEERDVRYTGCGRKGRVVEMVIWWSDPLKDKYCNGGSLDYR